MRRLSRAGFVVRGVVLVELIATTLRLGWLYLISPVRLCSNYLLDDQQRVGRILLVVGFAILLVLVWRLMWGHVDSGHTNQEGSEKDVRFITQKDGVKDH